MTYSKMHIWPYVSLIAALLLGTIDLPVFAAPATTQGAAMGAPSPGIDYSCTCCGQGKNAANAQERHRERRRAKQGTR